MQGERDRLARGLPVPPPHLQLRVGGDSDDDKFLGTGLTIYADLKRTAWFGTTPMQDAKSILDFGCGVSRVLRFLPDSAKVTGVDIDPEAIAWCRKNIPGVRFEVGPKLPPLPFPDDSFDLIYAVSVFTHLPEDMAEAWVAEMRRILSPEGSIIVTFLGSEMLASVSPVHSEQLARDGIVYSAEKTDGLPDFYGITFHTREFVTRQWEKGGFEVMYYHPKSIASVQDAMVCRRAR